MDLGVSSDQIRSGLIFFLLLFSVLVLRAFAQAWVADRLGDPTPAQEGRVTLYPVPHIDLLGTVVLPLICIFYLQPRLGQINFFLAWTKPVPINPSNFAHPRRDDLLAQLAGSIMCFLIALLSAIAGGLLLKVEPRSMDIFGTLIGVSSMLIVLDLLPLPPLPGGMILRHWGIISEELYWGIARWSGLALLIAFNIPPIQRLIGLGVALVAMPFGLIYDLLSR
jgi:Zn-dependent protease